MISSLNYIAKKFKKNIWKFQKYLQENKLSSHMQVVEKNRCTLI